MEYCDKTQNISRTRLGQFLFQTISLSDNISPGHNVTKCQIHRRTLGYLLSCIEENVVSKQKQHLLKKIIEHGKQHNNFLHSC